MKHTLFTLGILFLMIGFSLNGFALAQAPPSDLDDTLQVISEEGYNVSFMTRGWGTVYGLPQSQFSIDELDFYDNSADFGEVGMYALGLNLLLNPQFSDLDLNANSSTKLKEVATSTLSWLWTPENIAYGVHHKEKLPNGGITNVLDKVMGINTASNACIQDASIAYNQWGVPKDTITKQTISQTNSIAGAGMVFLYAIPHDSANAENYRTIAKGIGDMLISAMVTPSNQSFGLHPEDIKDQHDQTIPVGMMPMQFIISPDANDSNLCSDGGTIKLQENRKTWIAQSAVFLNQLYEETNDTKYRDAAQIATNGILSLQQCDGGFEDYTRWEGSGNFHYVCEPDDGSAEYEAYPANVATAVTKGYIVDTATILVLLNKVDPTLYQSNDRFKKAVQYLLALEEEDIGGGVSMNGDPLQYASYAIDTETRAYAQILLSNVFLRAACQETNSEIEKRLEVQAYDLINSANVFIPNELDSKIADAISPDVGNNLFASAVAADSWKIITKGCQDCADGDGDGYINGVCANDTVKYDCNDADATIHPGASETCNMIDDNCDGKIDETFDEDKDGVSTCAMPVDCNDNNEDVFPGALEKVDQVDNDCNGKLDDAGLAISVQSDQNTGVPNVAVLVIEYGNACANSFANPAASIPDIKSQCSTIGSCTTDDTGTCLVEIKKDGKFQALAGVGENGLTSQPVEYQVGKNTPILLQAEEGVIIPSDNTDTNNTTPTTGSTTNNPYLFWGFIIVAIVICGVVALYLLKNGKKIATLPRTKPPAGKPLSPLNKEDNKILNTPIVKTGGFSFPKLSGKKFAEKIVKGKIDDPKSGILKPSNFPAKKDKKLWK